MEVMTDDSIMTFGKYKGQALANVPASYLLALHDRNRAYGPLKSYISENLDILRNEERKERLS